MGKSLSSTFRQITGNWLLLLYLEHWEFPSESGGKGFSSRAWPVPLLPRIWSKNLSQPIFCHVHAPGHCTHFLGKKKSGSLQFFPCMTNWRFCSQSCRVPRFQAAFSICFVFRVYFVVGVLECQSLNWLILKYSVCRSHGFVISGLYLSCCLPMVSGPYMESCVRFRINDRDSMINVLDSNEDPGFRTKKFCLHCDFGIIDQWETSIIHPSPRTLTTLLTKTTEHTKPKAVCNHHQKLQWRRCRCQVQHFYSDVDNCDDDQHCYICEHVHDQFQESWACAGAKLSEIRQSKFPFLGFGIG